MGGCEICRRRVGRGVGGCGGNVGFAGEGRGYGGGVGCGGTSGLWRGLHTPTSPTPCSSNWAVLAAVLPDPWSVQGEHALLDLNRPGPAQPTSTPFHGTGKCSFGICSSCSSVCLLSRPGQVTSGQLDMFSMRVRWQCAMAHCRHSVGCALPPDPHGKRAWCNLARLTQLVHAFAQDQEAQFWDVWLLSKSMCKLAGPSWVSLGLAHSH